MESTVLPNFICVGAQKAGSSSLYKLLKTHPEIHMSEKKEIHFFEHDEEYSKGLAYYADFFSPDYQGQKCIGEISPDYMQFKQVPQRILSSLGHIKIIFILRNPVDRAYSQLNFHKMLKLENRKQSFEELLDQEEISPVIESRENWYTPSYYKSKSLYYEQVKQFVDVFGMDNIHVVIFEEMLQSNHPNLKDTCRFLGIDENHQFSKDHSNPTVMNFHSKKIVFLRKVKNHLKGLVPSSVLARWNEQLKRALYKKPSKLSPERKKAIFAKHFKNDVQKLEKLLGREIPLWHQD